MLDVFHGDEIKAYSTGVEILGVESIEISTKAKTSLQRMLGSTADGIIPTDTPDQTVSISRYLVGVDNLLPYTGSGAFPMSIHHNGIVHSFLSGYLTDYSVNCAVGAVPKVSTNFTVYDEIAMINGNGQSGAGVVAPSIPQQGSIICTCDFVSTNRVVGFDLNITTSREPIYVIGKKKPETVVQNAGLQYSFAVQIDMDDAFLTSGLAFLDEREDRVISLVVKDKTETTDFINISLSNASLTDQSLSASADGGLKLTLNYQGNT